MYVIVIEKASYLYMVYVRFVIGQSAFCKGICTFVTGQSSYLYMVYVCFAIRQSSYLYMVYERFVT